MRFEKSIDNDTILVSSVSDGDAAVLETLGYAHSSVNDREIDDRNGFKISCECWTKKKTEAKLIPLVLHYSFDSEVSVWLFGTEAEAKAELKRQFEEEKRIELEENKHVEGRDVIFKMSDDGTWASIINNNFGDEPDDVTEWSVGNVRN